MTKDEALSILKKYDGAEMSDCQYYDYHCAQNKITRLILSGACILTDAEPCNSSNDNCSDATDTSNSMCECFHCGEKSVVWDSDFDFADYGLEGEGIINHCHCTNCGAEIDYKVSCEERKNSDA